MNPIMWAALLPFAVGSYRFWRGYWGWRHGWLDLATAKHLMDTSRFWNIWAAVTMVMGLLAQLAGLV